MNLLRSIAYASRLKVAALFAMLAALGLYLFASVAPGPFYDTYAAARRPLVIISGVTQQLPTADWISTIGGLTTNATAPSAGEVETTTLTASGVITGGGVTNTGQMIRSGTISPTLGASESNWNPTGLATASTINATLTGATTITGLAAQPTGTEILLRNASDVYELLLAGNSGASSSENQFDLLVGSFPMQPHQTILLRYTGSKWVGVAHGGGTYMGVPNFFVSSVLTAGQVRLAVTDITTTGTQHDIAPGNATVVTYSGGGTATLTGFLGGSTGRPLIIQNLSNNALTLAHNTGSVVGRRLVNPGGVDVVLPAVSAVDASAAAAVYVYLSGTNWALVGTIGTTNSIPTTFGSTKNRGTITLSGGTGTATVTSGAVCTCTDTTATNVVQCAVSSTTLTATGTTTDVISYLCF